MKVDFTKYYAAQKADEAFHDALVSAFGKDACNRRYDIDKSGWPQHVIEAWNRFHKASNAWQLEQGNIGASEPANKGYGYSDTPSAKRRQRNETNE